MSKQVKVYIALVIAVGLAALATSVAQFQTQSWAVFLLYAGATGLASGFKVRLPGITGTVSAAFFPVLTGIVCLSVPETLIPACVAVLIQCLWHSRSRQLLKPVFNMASVAIAVECSAALFHSRWLHTLDFEFAVRLSILGAAYFAANTLPVAGVIALTERKSIWSVWRGIFWSAPLYFAGAAAAGLFQLAKGHLGWQTALLFIPVVCLIYRSCTTHIGRINDARIHAEETAALHLRTITSLALAIEAKDQETHEHLRRVQVYAVEIGRELGLQAEELEALRAAALLHDIGKIAVPDHIINKPGKLTPEEFQKMKVHPVVGAEILERVRFPFAVAPIVRCHHEKWDGTGYPAGLKGEEIPLGSRILTAVDCLDALASDRQYRRAMPLDKAMAALESESGTAFDPRVIAVLKQQYIRLEQKARSSPLESWRLSTNIHIEKGAAPGAGFAEARAPQSTVAVPAEFSDLGRLKLLLEAVNSGERFLNVSETLSIVGSRLRDMVGFDSLGVYLLSGTTLNAAYTMGTLAPLSIGRGQGVSGWALEANRPILNANASLEARGAGSAVAVPLPGSMGPAGVLTIYNTGENAFDLGHLEALSGIAAQLGAYLERNGSEGLPYLAPPAMTAASALLVH
jgi:putative nucleotidyltransferase with HDIG domain